MIEQSGASKSQRPPVSIIAALIRPPTSTGDIEPIAVYLASRTAEGTAAEKANGAAAGTAAEKQQAAAGCPSAPSID